MSKMIRLRYLKVFCLLCATLFLANQASAQKKPKPDVAYTPQELLKYKEYIKVFNISQYNTAKLPGSTKQYAKMVQLREVSAMQCPDLLGMYAIENFERLSYASSLSKLNLSNNNFLAGYVPESELKREDLRAEQRRRLNSMNSNMKRFDVCLGFLRSKIADLDLSKNRLIHMPKAVAGYSSLTKLNLWRNNLETFFPVSDTSTVVKFTNLTHLWLHENKLKKFPRSILVLTDLEYLDLSSNEINDISTKVGVLENLNYLSLANNSLRDIPSELFDLTALTYLDLSHNIMLKVPSNLGQLTNLQELNLSHNEISLLPSSIGQLKNLENLSLTRNYLATLPESFRNLTNLKTLSLSYNYVGNFLDIVADLPNLEHLYLRNNDLIDLPPDVLRLQKLKTLDLSANPQLELSTLVVLMSRMQSLDTLILEDNEMLELSPNIDKLTNLSVLNLRGNYLDHYGELNKILVHDMGYYPTLDMIDAMSEEERVKWNRVSGRLTDAQLDDKVILDHLHQLKASGVTIIGLDLRSSLHEGQEEEEAKKEETTPVEETVEQEGKKKKGKKKKK